MPGRKNQMLWNAGGNILYLGTQWLVTVLVTILGGLEDAGVLSVAMSVSATFQTIALFGVRNYQVSDGEGRFSHTVYASMRIPACLTALIFCLLFSFFAGYRNATYVGILWFMLFRLAESYSDVLHGIAQRCERLDIAGKSFAIKGAGLLVCFLAGYLLTDRLNVGLCAMALFSLGTTLCYDLPAVRRVTAFGLIAPKGQLASLVLATLPLCAYQFLYAAIATLPKLCLEKACGEVVLGAYSSIYAPAMLLQSAGGYLYIPFATGFTRMKDEGRGREAVKLLAKISAAIVLLFALVTAVAYFLGEWGLVLVFGETIRPYVYLLIPILFVNLAITLLAFFSMLMVVLRKIALLLAGYAAAFVLTLTLTPPLIARVGVNGTSYGLLIGASVAILWFLGVILYRFLTMKPERSL